MCALIPPASAAGAAPAASSASPEWRLLAPIPDPVGFGGMFSGVLDGRLVTGGGSQFRERPLWLKGEKSFSDRIYVLDQPDGVWRELETKLPEKAGHYGWASSGDTIYLAGGMTSAGYKTTCHTVRMSKGSIEVGHLPDLPKPVGLTSAAVSGGRLYLLGGQNNPAEKVASAEVWSLGLKPVETAWRREQDIPGPATFVAASASDDRAVYVFGGMTFGAESKSVPSKAAYRFDTARRAWEKLPDMPEARVGAATPCPMLPDGRFFVIGGYSEVFPGAIREHPGFNAQTLVFDPASRRWENGPVLPRAPIGDRDLSTDKGPLPMIAAPGTVWKNLAVVIGGEVRGATRTTTVIAWPLSSAVTRK